MDPAPRSGDLRVGQILHHWNPPTTTTVQPGRLQDWRGGVREEIVQWALSLEWLDKVCYEKMCRGLDIGDQGAIHLHAPESEGPRGLINDMTDTRTTRHAPS